jgi:hypothetical protein
MEIWTKYRVSLNFITKLCASVPADSNLIQKWLETRQPKVKAPGGRSIDEINEEVLASLPEGEEAVSGLVFQRANWNGAGLVVRAATIRAHMKDCSRIISSHYVGKIEGERSFAVKVKNCVYHDETEYWLPILRPDGSKIMEADGTKEKAIHVTDARGRPMNALKLFEYVEPSRVDFTIKVLGGAVPLKDLETLFIYGGTHGYAGERSDGEGRYTFKIEEITDRKGVRDDGNKGKSRTKDSQRPDSSQRESL